MRLNCGKKSGSTLFFIIIFNVFCLAQKPNPKLGIKGNFQLDSIWTPTVYLSYISNFDRMYTMSKEMIVAKAPLDTYGNFKFDVAFLPNETGLYRIHVAKKNNPIASLIIGGAEENHFFLLADSKSNITITNLSKKTLFQNIKIEGNRSNNQFKKIDEIYTYMDSIVAVDTYVKSEFITKAIEEKLRFVADSSTNPMVSLYALYRSNYESNYKINQQFYEDYVDKWNSENSNYFKQFRTKLPLKKKNTSFLYLIIGCIFFVLGLFMGKYILNKKRKPNSPLISLSVQERKIFSLIQEGKSNKEISDEYNIGVSTVKSHVSNIYSKLNIRSRKDAMNLDK